MCLSFLLLFPISLVGSRLDVYVRVLLGRMARKAEEAQRNGADLIVYRYVVTGLFVGFIAAFVVLAPLIFLSATLLIHVFPLLPSSWVRASGFAFYIVPLLGAADLMVRLDDTQDRVLFFLGFAAAAATVLIVNVSS